MSLYLNLAPLRTGSPSFMVANFLSNQVPCSKPTVLRYLHFPSPPSSLSAYRAFIFTTKVFINKPDSSVRHSKDIWRDRFFFRNNRVIPDDFVHSYLTFLSRNMKRSYNKKKAPCLLQRTSLLSVGHSHYRWLSTGA